MKRYILTCLLTIAVLAAHAQITFNGRVGVGVLDSDHEDGLAGLVGYAQANIPISENRLWVFSPTIAFATEFVDSYQLDFPLLFGYKFRLGRKVLLIQKVGPMIGIECDEGEFVIGPATELSVETKHFITSLNLNLSLVERYRRSYSSYYSGGSYYLSNASISFGYKF